MEDTKETTGKDANDDDTAAAVVNDEDDMVIETHREKEGSPLPLLEMDTNVENKEESPPAVVKEDSQNDHNAPVHNTPLPNSDNDFSIGVGDQTLAKPSEPGDVEIEDASENVHDNSGEIDDVAVGSKNPVDSPALREMHVETVDKREEMHNGVSEMESPTASGTKEEEELIYEPTTAEVSLDNDIKEEQVNNGVPKMKLLPDNETREDELNGTVTGTEGLTSNQGREELLRPELDPGHDIEVKTFRNSFLLEPNVPTGEESGTEEDQAAFMKELETFHKERCLEFKPPRFYGEPLNCLKLWRAVIRLGGYEQVTSCKLWRQVGESFKPPKTCTTVSWTFRCFYEKALLEYEKYKMRIGELPFTDASVTEPAAAGNQASLNQSSGSGRARRDAAARAMQGWHSQRLLGNGEVGDPIIKDKNSSSVLKREKQFKSIGLLKRKKPSPVERSVTVARMKGSKPQLDTVIVDVGPPADWVKVNVQRTKDCFEVYALVPGLLREEVRVQSDPVGRLVISGQPEQLDNPWGVAAFKKVVSLPSRIDAHQTSAVVTLHGQLFVRVPFEQSDL